MFRTIDAQFRWIPTQIRYSTAYSTDGVVWWSRWEPLLEDDIRRETITAPEDARFCQSRMLVDDEWRHSPVERLLGYA